MPRRRQVMNGEGGPNLFPKPVHEEPPLEQRAKMQQRERESHLTGNWSKRLPDADHKNTDVPRFNALCRGEELRVITIPTSRADLPADTFPVGPKRVIPCVNSMCGIWADTF